ncbi:MAG: hypothetical protein H7239_13125 [Flavobacterium sp.]|nr:hypothetical protein [Flavobacterium sp.]
MRLFKSIKKVIDATNNLASNSNDNEIYKQIPHRNNQENSKKIAEWKKSLLPLETVIKQMQKNSKYPVYYTY